jgi:hypothetical protein
MGLICGCLILYLLRLRLRDVALKDSLCSEKKRFDNLVPDKSKTRDVARKTAIVVNELVRGLSGFWIVERLLFLLRLEELVTI